MIHLRHIFFFSVFLPLLLVVQMASSQVVDSKLYPDSVIVTALSLSDYSYIDTIIALYGPDATFHNGEHTLLSYSVIIDNISAVEYIVNKAADIDLINNDLTPLMICATYNRDRIANYLLLNRAKVDKYNKHRNTPLIMAARYGHLEVARVLSKYNANPFFENFTNQSPLDYSIRFNKVEVAEFLKGYMVAYVNKSNLHFSDGPHVFWGFNKRAQAVYFIRDSFQKKSFSVKQTFRTKNDTLRFSGFYNDTLSYLAVNKKYLRPEPHSFTDVPKIFAIGDVHGEYTSLVKLLRANGIMDSSNNWIWGNGHVVFIGDLFDRGTEVTQTLWLVYKLYLQASKHGGYVHLILGNHELMILTKDFRFVEPRYKYLYSSLYLDYDSPFSTSTALGAWIRSRNTAVVLNGNLFVHGGYSTRMIQQNMSIGLLNSIVYNALMGVPIIDPAELDRLRFISEEYGPFWYRGLMAESHLVARMTQTELNAVLGYCSASAMVVGHTEVKDILPQYNGKVFPINVPFAKPGIKPMGLLIKANGYYKCNIYGNCEKL
ncbi:MAG: ankyrin repeat domain-containing protein [Bacteroidales bacterium]|nr:ankyrin repeat domain-containing protein [Bacteroidales bacterium]MBN2750031.1 ankyrin repeat domain-containing protein [Bacteroidales bacterium]